MKLISCYIAGFGQIKDFSYDFDEGLNTILRENGWGKTTFTAFLKAMFYGMEYSPRKKDLLDRTHYQPWDGTRCAGNLTFEAKGKVYRVERSFGKSDKDDTFALVDVLTGQPSTDFGQNLGEELFQVDRDSFENSIFVGQGQISARMTDSLNAKMGNLSASKDDINNFDAALNRVDEAIKGYERNSKSNTGKLRLLKEEMSKCREVIDKKPAVRDGYHKQKEKLDTEYKRLSWLEAEKERTAELILAQSKREQELGAYQQQVEDVKAQKEKLKRVEGYFINGVPSEEEHQQMEALERQVDLDSRRRQELAEKLPPLPTVEHWEKLFAQGNVDKETLENWWTKADRLAELSLQEKHAQLSPEGQQQLKELQIFFARKLPELDELLEMERATEELTALDARIASQEEAVASRRAKLDYEEKSGHRKRNIMILLLPIVVGLIFLAAGAGFWALDFQSFWHKLLTYGCLGAGGVCILVGNLYYAKRCSSVNQRLDEIAEELEADEDALEASRQERGRLKERVDAFLGQFMLNPTHSPHMMVYDIRQNREMFLHLQEQDENAQRQSGQALEELANLRMVLYTVLEPYANVYGMNLYADACESQLLEKLEKDAEFYEDYCSSKEQLTAIRTKLEQEEAILAGYLRRFPQLEEGSRLEQLKEIHHKREHYLGLKENIRKRDEELAVLRAKTMEGGPTATVEELQQQQDAFDEEIRRIHETVLQDKDALSDISQMLEEIEEAERHLDEMTETRAVYERQLDLLKRTADGLKEAKEQFLGRYMSPLRQAMSHYLDKMDPAQRGQVSADDVDLTMDLSVRISSQGESHSSEYLSRGYQDLVALCARFALTDVIYKGEKPILVLDDPFTNLDAEKTASGLALLDAIAEERQILYFTCHGSRMPEA